MSALANLERFGEEDPFSINWRSCRHCLQSEWPWNLSCQYYFLTQQSSNPQFNSTLNITDCSKLDGFGDGSISKEAYISAIIIGLVRLLASLLLSRLLRDYCRRFMYFASAALTITSLVCFATCIVCINRYLWNY